MYARIETLQTIVSLAVRRACHPLLLRWAARSIGPSRAAGTRNRCVVCGQEVTVNARPKRVASCAGGVRGHEVAINALPKLPRHSDGAGRILSGKSGGRVHVAMRVRRVRVRAALGVSCRTDAGPALDAPQVCVHAHMRARAR